MTAPAFTDANALAVLLTAEGLLFAALSVSVSLSNVGNRPRKMDMSPYAMGIVAATVIAVIAFGAFAAWWEIFVPDWPSGRGRSVFAVAILVAIVAQPAMTVLIARSLRVKK